MELKKLNKITVLIACAIGMNVFSQMKMADIQDKKFSIDLKREKSNIIKILDNTSYSVYYILDRRGLDFDKGRGTVDTVNLIFFSKKYNKGILTVFKQGIVHKNKSVYNIRLDTGSIDNYMFIPSMLIIDKDFNYEYLIKYHYLMPPPPKEGDYSSWITIEYIKNHCNFKDITLNGNLIYEDIDDILSNVPDISINEDKSKECNPLISDEDLKYFFPKRIDKNGPVYYKK
ncbi:hypothetical protein [uncultured Chryseobacterium sp.]|uniref:hypothetical protein n=1 Tax=uncultured Chryseobacterium sp. TaxID=259322 RepID=UPI0025F344E9|nr:hypothetical protein [uncultured Chryseobacterium sp.]